MTILRSNTASLWIFAWLLAAAFFSPGPLSSAHAAESGRKSFDIPAGDALETLKQFVAQSGAQLLYSADEVEVVKTNAIRGDYLPEDALGRMLAGTNLLVQKDAGSEVLDIRRKKAEKGDGGTAGPDTKGGGSVIGRTINGENGTYLAGTAVSLEGLPWARTLTRRDGSFEFHDVPPGSWQLTAYYTGMPVESRPVTVEKGGTTEVKIVFESKVVQLEKFMVSSSRTGDAASITNQRNADNLINVASMDAFGSVADGAVGNFLVKLPGVTGNFENGEVTTISIRGTPPEFNSVMIDGVRTAGILAGSNPYGDRAAQVDQIPAEFIKEVELIKALLPETPADSIGGAANLIMKSAFDFESDALFYRAGVNHNMHRADLPQFTPNFAMTYLTRRGQDGNFGITTSLSYTDSVSPRDRVDMQRVEADGRNTQARTLAQANRRIRWGGALRLDYKPDESLLTYLKLDYSYFNVDRPRTTLRALVTGSRRVADYSVVSRAAIEAGAVPKTTSGQSAGVAPGFTDTFTELLNSTWSYESRNPYVTSKQLLAEFGLTKKLSAGQQVKFRAGYNPSKSDSFNRIFTATLGKGIGMTVDTRGGVQNPVFAQTYGPSVAFGSDFTKYTAAYSELPESAKDSIVNVDLDYLKETYVKEAPLTFKSGVSWRMQKRRNAGDTSPRNNWTLVGADGIAGTNAKTGVNDDDIAQFKSSRPGYSPEVQGTKPWAFPVDDLNLDAVQRLLQTSPGLFKQTTVAPPDQNKIRESVLAAYVQGRLVVGKLSALTGVRMERTDDVATGPYADPQNSATSISAEGSYSHFFPSLHLRYEITPSLLARASYSTGMSRPNINDLYPATTVSYANETVTQSNTRLKAQYSKNFDLSLEYYFEPSGVVSVGVFRKDITGFLASSVTQIGSGADNGFNGNFVGFDLISKSNLGAAEIEGLEFNYRQTLSMLPAPFNGLDVFGNFTKLRTSGTYANGETELEGFVPTFANAGISYRWHGFESRVSLSYSGESVTSYNSNPYATQRFKALTTVDLSFAYTFRPALTVFLDVVNLEDKWPVIFSGTDSQRVRVVDSYGTRLNIGISGRF